MVDMHMFFFPHTCREDCRRPVNLVIVIVNSFFFTFNDLFLAKILVVKIGKWFGILIFASYHM